MKDLRSFLQEVQQKTPDDFINIKEPVSAQCNATSIVLELEKKNLFPILFFEKITNLNIPVVCNLLANRDRMALAVRTTTQNLHEDCLEILSKATQPKAISEGPVKEKTHGKDAVNVSRLPILKHFEGDAAPYITGGILVARDPENGRYNLSFHRMQLKGKNKFGISLHSKGHLWEYQKKAEENGNPLEVAVVIGHHPSLDLTAVWKVPIEIDEYDAAGAFLGEPLKTVECDTLNMQVPAAAEIVIEEKSCPMYVNPKAH